MKVFGLRASMAFFSILCFCFQSQAADIKEFENYNVKDTYTQYLRIYDLEKIGNAIASIEKDISKRFNGRIPPVECMSGSENDESKIISETSSNQVLPTKAISIIEDMSNFLFSNRSAFSVKAGKGPTADTLVYHRLILVNPDYAASLLDGSPDKLIQYQFAAAHEISHYLYEYWIRFLSPNEMSPNGQPRFCGGLPLGWPNKVITDFTGITQRVVNFYSSMPLGMAHAEINSFAAWILHNFYHYDYRVIQLAAEALFVQQNIPMPNETLKFSDLSDDEVARYLQGNIWKWSTIKTLEGLAP